jgi:hypothetical protein
MTGSSATLRSLVIYALVLPLALLLGYLLAQPLDLWTMMFYGMVAGILAFPLLIKWHRPMLFMAWNMTAVVFLLPGRPQLWFVMAFLSLLISIVQRTILREMRFLHVPSLVLPLLFIALVVYLTGKVRGGFGLASFGGETIGGRRYWTAFAGIAGFLAMIAQRIPPQKAMLYVGLFFLAPILNSVGNTIDFVAPSFYWIFLIFPVEYLPGQGPSMIARFYGLTLAGMGVYYYLLARHGVGGILGARNLRRGLLLFGALALTMTGGYRSFFILMVMTFLFVFYYEGLLRSRYTVMLLLATILGAAIIVPLATKLPLSIQRTLSILPIEVDYRARESAQGSSEWRLKMWETLLPEIPEYFWFGKGLAIEGRELVMVNEQAQGDSAAGAERAKLAGDYHNGPLTVLIPFGIWGALGWLWFLAAGFRALYLNYRYGDESLKTINTFLLAYFLARVIHYMLIFGNFYSDIAIFAGIVGLGVSLNGGICQPARAPARARQPVNPPMRAARPAWASPRSV